MTKLSLCVAFTIALLVGMNSVPSLVYAQTDEESAQPEAPQTDNAAQPDETATPDESTEEQGDETQGEATDEPENGDEQSSQDQQ